MLEFDPEKRNTLRMFGGFALGVGAKMLGIRTAYASQVVNCPIYMFHGEGMTTVERVIRANTGKISVSVGQLAEIIMGERAVPNKPIFCLTFDDGLLIQYEQAKPVLDKYELEATFFVMGGLMDDTWTGDGKHTYMTPEQVKHLSGLGYEIGSHTVTHSSLTKLYSEGKYISVSDEIYHSREKLENATNQEVTSFAYPNGSDNLYIRNIVSEVYKTAVSTIDGTIQSESVLYLLRRKGPN